MPACSTCDSQAKQAHWNAIGPQFAALHALFDEVAEELDELSDTVAERAVMLGGTARGMIQVLKSESFLPGYPLDAFCGNDHVWALSAALTHVGRSAGEAIPAARQAGDDGTTDALTQVSRAADTLRWKVEAHIALEPRNAAISRDSGSRKP